MIQKQAQQGLEVTADNVVPFAATTATGEGIKLYTADNLKAEFAPTAQTMRTVRDLVAKVREAYHWLDEFEFKRGDKFTQFCFDQILAMKESGLTQKQWIAEIQKKAPLQEQQKPTEPAINTSTLARFVEPDDSPFSGLSITTKATDKREVLQAELVETEAEVDADFQAFMSLTTELITQDEAADDADDLEFQLLRKRNAAKWLKRKAILESDKQRILQGDILPKQSGNSPAAVS